MNRFRTHLLTYIQTQLIITLFSLPLLVHWGLGISWMSIVSNFIFAPVLTSFIIVSSLLFFTECIGIPNYPLVWSLDCLVWLWDSCLELGSKHWLIHCAHPGTLCLLIIPITTYLLLQSRYCTSVPKKIGALTMLLFISFVLFKFTSHLSDNTSQLRQCHPLQNKFSVTRNDDASLTFIDKGYFNAKSSPDKAIIFELKPFLTKKFGQCIINELTLTKPSLRSFWGTHELCKHIVIKKIRIPIIEQKLSKKAWNAFFTLKQACIKEKITLERFP